MVTVINQAPAFSKARADRAVNFIKSLKQHKGEWAGQPLALMPWQEEPLRKFFGTQNPGGTRQYRTLYIEIPRKNGKTTVSAGIGAYLLFADNEPGAEIYSAANDREQASLVYNEFSPMVKQAPALAKRSKIIDSRKRIIVPGTNSFYQVLSSEAYTKWGYNIHGTIYDELHASPNRDLWDVLTTSSGARRQPALIIITTAGYDRHSICWEQHEYALKVRDGIVDDPTFLPVLHYLDEEEDWTDEDNWHIANPALGTFRKIDEMRALCKKAQVNPGDEMVFRRLYLNQWTSAVSRWIQMAVWDKCFMEFKEEDFYGMPCYAGLDLSSTTDITACVYIFPITGNAYAIIPRFWIPKDTAYERAKRDRVPYPLWIQQGYLNATEGNVIHYGAIKEQLIKDREHFDIKEVKYDRWGATKLVQDLEDEGFTCVPMGQGFASMSPPTKEFEKLCLEQAINHNGNPIMNWAMNNVVVAQDPAGNLKPDKSKATERIDPVVAGIMGLDGAIRHNFNSGKSVYDERGILEI